jgi:putative transposase
VIEEGRPLLGLVNYIHLNPVRAGIVTMAKLRKYEWSSYPKFFEPRPPESLSRGRFLSALEFPDSVAGMRQYARQLEFAEESNPAVRDSLAKRYCRGWAVASEEYRRDLKKMYAELEEHAGWGGREVEGEHSPGIALTFDATNAWIAERLSMGHPTRVCNLIRANM